MTVQRFEGVCSVCGAEVGYDYDWSQGIIDIGIEEDGRVFTWIRHYATAPTGANPDCAKFASVLWEVPA